MQDILPIPEPVTDEKGMYVYLCCIIHLVSIHEVMVYIDDYVISGLFVVVRHG